MSASLSPLPEPGSTRATWATWYGEHGFRVFPCHGLRCAGGCTCHKGHDCGSPAKHPITAHGVLDATTDLTIITRWWQEWPFANVGAATGYLFDTLDIDGMAAEMWQQEYGYHLPPTWRTRTGSGGAHCHFSPSPELKNAVKRIAHADTRCKGGYVLLPPSKNRNGAYTWTVPPTGIALAPWPADLLAALMPPKMPPPKLAPKPAGTVATIPENLTAWADRGAPLGEQTSRAFWLACRLRQHGASDTDALRVLARYARACTPPADWRKVERIWHDSARYQGYDPHRPLPHASYQEGHRL